MEFTVWRRLSHTTHMEKQITSQVNDAWSLILYIYLKRNFLICFTIFLLLVDVGETDLLSRFYEGEGSSER